MTRHRVGHWVTTLTVGAVISVAAFGAPWTIEGRVVGVSDGDTITLLDDAKTRHKIPAGIDSIGPFADLRSCRNRPLNACL